MLPSSLQVAAILQIPQPRLGIFHCEPKILRKAGT